MLTGDHICIAEAVVNRLPIDSFYMGWATIWEAVFADMGTALIAVANSTRIIGKMNS